MKTVILLFVLFCSVGSLRTQDTVITQLNGKRLIVINPSGSIDTWFIRTNISFNEEEQLRLIKGEHVARIDTFFCDYQVDCVFPLKLSYFKYKKIYSIDSPSGGFTCVLEKVPVIGNETDPQLLKDFSTVDTMFNWGHIFLFITTLCACFCIVFKIPAIMVPGIFAFITMQLIFPETILVSIALRNGALLLIEGGIIVGTVILFLTVHFIILKLFKVKL